MTIIQSDLTTEVEDKSELWVMGRVVGVRVWSVSPSTQLTTRFTPLEILAKGEADASGVLSLTGQATHYPSPPITIDIVSG